MPTDRPTDPDFFAVLPVEQKISLVSSKPFFILCLFWLSVGTTEPKISKESMFLFTELMSAISKNCDFLRKKFQTSKLHKN